MAPAYIVKKMHFDATRPWVVVATFRSFDRVVARYDNERDAKRRARDMNKRSDVPERLRTRQD